MVLKNKKANFTPLLVDENSSFSQILLVGEENVILSKQEALRKAQDANLNLLCIAPQVNPPVCKLIDYQKYIFELRKQAKHKVSKVNIEKKIRISFVISENDLQTKLNRIHYWLDKKFIVKINLLTKGKDQQELGLEKCQRIIEELKSQSPKIELRGNIRSLPRSFYFFLGKKK